MRCRMPSSTRCWVKACEASRRTRLLCGGSMTLIDSGETMGSGVIRG
ncbi:hypothetical protein QFZ74_003550 [Streptomyces sp. V3I7]|nr:hypothetical protein [Streptomyces sp. V3I7]